MYAIQTLARIAGVSFLGRMINIEDARAREEKNGEVPPLPLACSPRAFCKS